MVQPTHHLLFPEHSVQSVIFCIILFSNSEHHTINNYANLLATQQTIHLKYTQLTYCMHTKTIIKY